MTASTPLTSRDIVAGAAAEGHGAIVGWSGQGALARSEIVQALADAGLPLEWAPAQQSAISDAGRSLREAASGGHVRRVKAQRTDKFDARWIVFRADDGAQVGDKAGRVVLAAELHGDQLVIAGDSAMEADVRAAYDERRNGQLYAAGDVTAWLRSTLYARAGATAFGVGYYVPATGRDVAGRLAAAVSRRWGSAWICPLLPVATGDELRAGIARGLSDDVRGVATSLASLRAAAGRDNRADVRSGEAARLLAELGAIHERTAAYRLLCGDAVIAPIVTQIASLRETLLALTNDASVRFAMLDLDTPAEAAAAAPLTTPAERAADIALAARRAEVQTRAVEEQAEGPQPGAGVIVPMVPRDPAPARRAEVSLAPALEPNDAAQRFSLLELD